MRVLRTIARALAAAMALVTTMVWESGKWVLKCIPGYQPPAPQDVVEEYVDAAVTVDVTPEIDQRIAGIQATADALLTGRTLDPATLDGLSPKSVAWLELLDDDMLQKVVDAKPATLMQHLTTGSQIQGLLRFEEDTMNEYRRAVEADKLVPKRPAKSRKEDLELFAPALGK